MPGVSRLVLVHGSVTGGGMTWAGQIRELGDRFSLLVFDRPGFPPGPPVDRVDFEEHAALVAAELQPGDHLVGHSYGGVVSLLAAAAATDLLASLTVIEPPCTQVARGNPAADEFARVGREWWERGPTDDPEAFLRGFLRAVGSAFDPPSPLPPALEQGARMLIVERGPWEAEVPLEALRAAPFPKLVVSGAHHRGFDAICDALVIGLEAERADLPGFGHSAQRHPEFGRVLAEFVERASGGSR